MTKDNIYKPEVIEKWNQLYRDDFVTWDDWDDFLGDWYEEKRSPRKDGK